MTNWKPSFRRCRVLDRYQLSALFRGESFAWITGAASFSTPPHRPAKPRR